MRVSRKSWHFRLYTILVSMWTEGPMIFDGDRTTHRPRDLCHYFWTIVLLMLFAPLWIAVMGAALIVFGIFYFVFYWPWDKFVAPPYRARKIRKKAELAEKRRLAGLKEEETKKPGLIKSYLKARKQKVCPIIRVVD